VSLRTYATAAAAAGLLAVAIPVADASAADAPAASGQPASVQTPASSWQMPAFNFVPPSVGPISVDIGRTIINGQIISQGLHVLMPGTTLPPLR
jgi:hypothetical protein